MLPILYEVWRMAYFALIVSNTALAKSAGSTWWNQAFTYLWNSVSSYTLWLPFLMVIPLMAPRIVRWWRGGDRIGVALLMTPIVAIVGDYQHARLLLPAFFANCLALCFEVDQLRTLAVIPVAVIVV
jgi:arabinofuranosyltransferase